MLKSEKEYNELYGDIPKDYFDRLNILIKSLRKKKKKEKINIFDEIRRINLVEWKTVKFIVWLVPKATPRPRIKKMTQGFYVSGSDIIVS